MEEEKYQKKQRIYKTIMLVVLTAFLSCILTTLYISSNYEIGTSKGIISSIISGEDDNLTTSLKNIEKIMEKYFLYDIDEQKVIDGAIDGYISALNDEYTEYIPAEQMEEYTENITGNYVGVGIYMLENKEQNRIEVLSPIVESPAAEAGILPGDIIFSVNGVEYTGEQIDEASNEIKGPEGTTVKLVILRGEEKIEFEITRKKINTNPVISKKLDNNIGYLEITSFDEGTAEDFKSKFENLKNEGITSLIIDLRNNGGGIVDEALQIADYIVPKGKDLLITVDKNQNEKIEKAEQDPIIDMPIVVLVNENTASSSEILAGALKDLEEATIVGTTTYGKGVIQQVISLRTGAGIKVTVEEYYTPNRNKINGVGIEPDEKVELPETVENPLLVTDEEDTQLQKAIEILK